MADTVESVLQEIFPKGVRPPKPGETPYRLVAYLAQLIIDARVNESLKPYERQHQINGLWAEIHNAVAREKFERGTPHRLRKFYPGGSSELGFLGWGESLDGIIADDKQTLRHLRKIPVEPGRERHEVVGNTLKKVLDNPRDFPKIKLIKSSGRGGQGCPFDECYDAIYPHSDMEFTIVRGRIGLVGPGMIWHLIEAHCFFEGAYTPYRVDPEPLVDILFG